MFTVWMGALAPLSGFEGAGTTLGYRQPALSGRPASRCRRPFGGTWSRTPGVHAAATHCACLGGRSDGLSAPTSMVVFVSVRQRLYPDPVQLAGLRAHADHARFVFNLGLEQRALWSRDKHARGIHPERGDLNTARVNTASQMRELAELRQSLGWLRLGSSSVQQAVLRDLDRAFSNFYAGRAKYPAFQRRDDRVGSFVFRDLTLEWLFVRTRAECTAGDMGVRPGMS